MTISSLTAQLSSHLRALTLWSPLLHSSAQVSTCLALSLAPLPESPPQRALLTTGGQVDESAVPSPCVTFLLTLNHLGKLSHFLIYGPPPGPTRTDSPGEQGLVCLHPDGTAPPEAGVGPRVSEGPQGPALPKQDPASLATSKVCLPWEILQPRVSPFPTLTHF